MTSAALAELAWDRLRSEPMRTSAELGIPSLALGVTTLAGNARLALSPDGRARLMLPLSAGEPFPNVGEARGLALTDSIFTVNGRPRRFADIVCKSEDLEEVFRDLVAEVLRRIEAGEAVARAVEGAVKDFRSLVLGIRSRDISSESAVGLLGELMVLDRVLALDAGAWKSWTGPSGGRHDFRAGPAALEVKGSVRAQKRTIQISALDQLAEPPQGSLVLFHQTFEENAGGSLTIPELAAKILSRCSDSQAVTDLLSSAGYDLTDSAQWSHYRFSPLQEEAYRVVPGFPRLVPANFEETELPLGVSHFRYTVDLSAASQFILKKEDFDEYLSRVVSCLNPS
jgi:hypothetical protein